MNYTPIDKPKLIGCLNCSPVPPKILPKSRKIYAYGGVELKTDNYSTLYLDEGITINRIMRLNKKRVENAKVVTVHIVTGTHDETYELNKGDGKWYLVKQGYGSG